MRPIYTLLLAIVLLGGTYAYIQFAEGVRRPPSQVVFEKAAGVTSVEIRRSFDCYADPGFDVNALTVEFGNQTVLQIERDIPATELISIQSLEGVEEGLNEINVDANAESPDAFLSEELPPTLRAMTVRILRDGKLVVEKRFVSGPEDLTIGGAINFDIPKTAKAPTGEPR